MVHLRNGKSTIKERFMQIFVKMMDGHTATFDVGSSMTGHDLKLMIIARLNRSFPLKHHVGVFAPLIALPTERSCCDRLRLIYGGHQLENGDELYIFPWQDVYRQWRNGIPPEATLTLIGRFGRNIGCKICRTSGRIY